MLIERPNLNAPSGDNGVGGLITEGCVEHDKFSHTKNNYLSHNSAYD